MRLTHPLIAELDDIATLPVRLTPSERLVLAALARRGDWRTGAECRPSVATIRDATGLSERTVQYALRRMTCLSPVGGAPCLRCGRVDVLVLTKAAGRYTPATYALALSAWVQPMLPERGSWVQNTTGMGAKDDTDVVVMGATIAPDQEVRSLRSGSEIGRFKNGARALPVGDCGIAGCNHGDLRRDWRCTKEATG